MNALNTKLMLATLAVAGTVAVAADAPKSAVPAAPAKPTPARSVFVMPSNAREGRDPFFPESTRPYEDQVASKKTVDANAFVVNGVSVEHGHTMVIINKHTFAVGDEGDVITPNGRVHLRLLEIHGNIAVIEVNGARRDLSLYK